MDDGFYNKCKQRHFHGDKQHFSIRFKRKLVAAIRSMPGHQAYLPGRWIAGLKVRSTKTNSESTG